MEINILSIYVIPMHLLLVTFRSSCSKKKKKRNLCGCTELEVGMFLSALRQSYVNCIITNISSLQHKKQTLKLIVAFIALFKVG